MAFVTFSTEDGADQADWAGPHYIGGTEVKVKRFVCPKVRESQCIVLSEKICCLLPHHLISKSVLQTEEDSDDEMDAAPAKATPWRSVGLGYLLEDAQWLEDEMK